MNETLVISVIIGLIMSVGFTYYMYRDMVKDKNYYEDLFNKQKDMNWEHIKKICVVEEKYKRYKEKNDLELSLTQQTNNLLRNDIILLEKQLKVYEDMAKKKETIKINDIKVGDTLIIQVNYPKLYSMGMPEILLKSAIVLNISPSRKYFKLEIENMKEEKIVWEKVDNLDIIEIIKKKEK